VVQCDALLLEVKGPLDLHVSLAELLKLLLIGQFLSDPTGGGTTSLLGPQEGCEFEWL
jgi:hypothetical protein